MIKRNRDVGFFSVSKDFEPFSLRIGQHTEPAQLPVGAADQRLSALGDGGSDHQCKLFAVERCVVLYVHCDITAVAVLDVNGQVELGQGIGDHGFDDGFTLQSFDNINAQLAGVIDL